MDQESLFTIDTGDHLALIQRMRAKVVAYEKRRDAEITKRMTIVKQLGEAEAALGDAIDGNVEPMSLESRFALVQSSHAKCEKLEAEAAESADKIKTWRLHVVNAEAEVKASIGGVQRDMLTEEVEAIEPPQPGEAQTVKDVLSKRMVDARDRAVRALIAAGGRLSCVELSHMIGVSAHGLGGLIDGDNRIRKTHSGRVGNLETNYELAD